MTAFIGIVSHTDLLIRDADYRCTAQAYRQPAELRDLGGAFGDVRAGNPWWPSSGGLLGAVGVDAPLITESGWWEQPDLTGGATYRFGVIGVTRDVYGSPLGGVTVKLYRTSTDEMVGSIVSGPTGAYVVTTPYYPDAHYLVMYKTGSPDVFGTSANTIQGE